VNTPGEKKEALVPLLREWEREIREAIRQAEEAGVTQVLACRRAGIFLRKALRKIDRGDWKKYLKGLKIRPGDWQFYRDVDKYWDNGVSEAKDRTEAKLKVKEIRAVEDAREDEAANRLAEKRGDEPAPPKGKRGPKPKETWEKVLPKLTKWGEEDGWDFVMNKVRQESESFRAYFDRIIRELEEEVRAKVLREQGRSRGNGSSHSQEEEE
jgi:hypothetical protein